jgi:hypothetical protein
MPVSFVIQSKRVNPDKTTTPVLRDRQEGVAGFVRPPYGSKVQHPHLNIGEIVHPLGSAGCPQVQKPGANTDDVLQYVSGFWSSQSKQWREDRGGDFNIFLESLEGAFVEPLIEGDARRIQQLPYSNLTTFAWGHGSKETGVLVSMSTETRKMLYTSLDAHDNWRVGGVYSAKSLGVLSEALLADAADFMVSVGESEPIQSEIFLNRIELLNAAGQWCYFWSEKGHGMYTV